MRILVLATICFANTVLGQDYSIHVSEEIKRTEKNSEFGIIGADQNAIYYKESWMESHAMLGFGRDFDYGVKLVKTDKSLKVIYSKDYSRELKDVSFLELAMLDEELYLLAKRYFNKEDTYRYYIAKIDKESGELENEFIEFGSAVVHNLMNPVNTYFSIGTGIRGFLYTVQESGEGDGSFQCSYVDKELKKKLSFTIKIPLDRKEYEWETIQYAEDDMFVISLLETRSIVDKKKGMRTRSTTFWIFDAKKRSLKRMGNDFPDLMLYNTTLFYNRSGELLASGLYRNTSKSDSSSNGYCILKTDIKSNRMVLLSAKEFNVDLISRGFVDDEGTDSKKGGSKRYVDEARKVIEEDRDPGNLSILSIEQSEKDGSFTFVGEYFKLGSRYAGTTNNSIPDRVARFETTYELFYITKDILIIHAGKDGQIKWIRTIPKSQYERTTSSNPYSSGNSMPQYPFYSSFSSLLNGEKLYLVLNDHSRNTENKGPGETVRTVCDFENQSKLYVISVDLNSGETRRKAVFTNDNKTILFPGLGVGSGHTFLIPIPNTDGLKKSIDFRLAVVDINQ